MKTIFYAISLLSVIAFSIHRVESPIHSFTIHGSAKIQKGDNEFYLRSAIVQFYETYPLHKCDFNKENGRTNEFGQFEINVPGEYESEGKVKCYIKLIHPLTRRFMVIEVEDIPNKLSREICLGDNFILKSDATTCSQPTAGNGQ